MTAFEIPTVVTAPPRLRVFRAGDLEAYAAMQANPKVMRYLVTGRTRDPRRNLAHDGDVSGGDRCAAKSYGPARQSRAAIHRHGGHLRAARLAGAGKKKIRLLSAQPVKSAKSNGRFFQS
jgi:RimJ/RimL family protein N-acetyltransferase